MSDRRRWVAYMALDDGESSPDELPALWEDPHTRKKLSIQRVFFYAPPDLAQLVAWGTFFNDSWSKDGTMDFLVDLHD